jgi:hypothetical protein
MKKRVNGELMERNEQLVEGKNRVCCRAVGGALSFNTSNWVTFIVQYIKCIDVLTVTRDYSTEDIA